MHYKKFRFLIIVLVALYQTTFALSQESLDQQFAKGIELLEDSKYIESDSVFQIIEKTESVSNLYYMYALIYRTFCQMFLDEFYQAYDLIQYTEEEQIRLALDTNQYLNTDIAYFYGSTLFRLGRTYDALTYYQKAVTLYEAFNSFDFRKEDLYSNIAVCYFDIADYDNAIIYLNKSISSNSSQITESDKAQWLGLKAVAYQYKKEYKISEELFNKAIDLIKRTENPEPILKLQLYDDLSLLMSETGRFDQAEIALQKVKLLNPQNDDLINYLQSTGKFYFRKGETGQSINFFDKAINESIELYGNKHFETSDGYLQIADAYYKLENYKKANEYYLQALNTLLPNNGELQGGDEIPNTNQFLIHKLALDIQIKRAKTFSKINQFDFAKSAVKSSMDILQYMLNRQIRIEDSKQNLVNYINSMYGQLIEISITENEFSYQLCQRGHGVLLNLHLRTEQAKSQLIKDNSLLEQHDNLRQKLSKLEAEASYYQIQKGADYNSSLENELFDIRKAYDQQLLEMQIAYPNIFSDQEFKKDAISDIHDYLNANDAALIEYYLTDTILYTFLLYNDEIKTFRRELPDDFYDLVQIFRNMTSTYNLGQFHDFVDSSNELYELLLADQMQEIKEDKSSIIIIPDNILNYVSFEALITTSSKDIQNGRYDLLSYLIKQYSISYHYSSLFLVDKATNIKNKVSAFAPIISDKTLRSSGLKELKYHVDEVVEINEITKGDIFLDTVASKTKFLERIKTDEIIHLATHAICNDSLPMKSEIYFSDKSLPAYEVYNLNHVLQMVVLSACETGKGKLQQGEGVMSMARAFLASGCKAVVTTLWEINDKATSVLMGSFYKNLTNDKGAHTALRQAKLNYISSVSSVAQAHPFYWSGFIMIGENLSYPKQSTYSRFFVYALVLLGLIVLVFLKLRRRHS